MGMWGEAGAGGKPKATIPTQATVQSTGKAKTAVRSSLVPHAFLLMPLKTEKCILVAQQYQQKVICESIPGHIWSSA